jgi:hypothetical protein
MKSSELCGSESLVFYEAQPRKRPLTLRRLLCKIFIMLSSSKEPPLQLLNSNQENVLKHLDESDPKAGLIPVLKRLLS